MTQNTAIITGTVAQLADRIQVVGLDGKARVLSQAQVSLLAGLALFSLDSKIPQPKGQKGKPTNVWSIPAVLSLTATVVTPSVAAAPIVDTAADTDTSTEAGTETTVEAGSDNAEPNADVPASPLDNLDAPTADTATAENVDDVVLG